RTRCSNLSQLLLDDKLMAIVNLWQLWTHSINFYNLSEPESEQNNQ
ncbi:14144_t:CDS:1, partial [Racocetra persica]